MSRRKTRVSLACPQCGNEFEIIKARLAKSEKHCCSITCSSRFSANSRAQKLRRKEYPYRFGACLCCGKDIIIINSSFDKPTRKFCGMSCKAISLNKGRKGLFTLEQRAAQAKRAKETFLGKKLTIEHRQKMSEANLGDKSHFWKGGLTKKNTLLRNSLDVKLWREAVFARDNYACVWCEARSGRGKAFVLNADHIKPWSTHPELRFDINNGRTLCLPCHLKTDTFGFKAILNKRKLI